MGQRSQLYIRYNNKKSLVAMHLQWNYGYYMINRTYQLLKYISKNIKHEFNNFQEKNFDYANHNTTREDIDILHNLIQMNLTIGSYVKGWDLVKEEYEWLKEKNELTETFKMIPKNQDNNNGILVIDIGENGTIKYGLGLGYEDKEDMAYDDDFSMVGANEYFIASEKNCDSQYKLENSNKELYDTTIEEIKYIEDNFELLTDEEYKEIFDTEYKYKDCMKEEEIKIEV